MLVATDPTDGHDIWISDSPGRPLATASSCSRLGLKGRRWAELWREIYGARLGIYNRKATESKAKGGKRPGTYSAAKCGVLATAEYVVQLSKQESQHGSGQRTPFGVNKSFLQSAVGDKNTSPYNSAKLIARLAELLEQQMTIIPLPEVRTAVTITKVVNDLEKIASEAGRKKRTLLRAI